MTCLHLLKILWKTKKFNYLKLNSLELSPRNKRSRTSLTNYRAARGSFRIRNARKMGREQKRSTFSLSPIFRASFSRPNIFRSARTGTLAKQAKLDTVYMFLTFSTHRYLVFHVFFLPSHRSMTAKLPQKCKSFFNLLKGRAVAVLTRRVGKRG